MNSLTNKQFVVVTFLAGLLLGFITIMLAGCAAAEPSSTDNHHQVPEINCTVQKYQGRYHHMCCENGTCVLID